MWPPALLPCARQEFNRRGSDLLTLVAQRSNRLAELIDRHANDLQRMQHHGDTWNLDRGLNAAWVSLLLAAARTMGTPTRRR